jgi:hypothetical protein
MRLQGVGVSTFSPKRELYPLVIGEDVARVPAEKDNARYTFLGTWKFSQEKKKKKKKEGNLPFSYNSTVSACQAH